MASSEQNGNGQHPQGSAEARVLHRDVENGDRWRFVMSAEGSKSMQRRLRHGFNRYLNPRKRSVQRGLLVFLCVAAASFDPLFFYIPMIDLNNKCLKIDRNLAVAAIVLRTLADLLHLAVWSVYNREEFHKDRSGDSSRGSKSEEEVDGFEVLSKRKEIAIEIFSILPLSQVTTWMFEYK